DHALTAGHPRCTNCHAPHRFAKSEVKPCTSCHRDQPVLAAAAHARCTDCHGPHDDKPRPCASCHHEQVAHPTSCTSCHPIHGTQAKALTCETCHAKPS